jgi:hypothetical protein
MIDGEAYGDLTSGRLDALIAGIRGRAHGNAALR